MATLVGGKSPRKTSSRKLKDIGGDRTPLTPPGRQHKTALDNPIVAEHAEAIRSLGKRVVADVIEIGCRLTECKELLGHGNWLPWLNREFGWSEDTALNFMRVDGLAKSRKFRDLNLPVSSLYLLAAPSTPPEVRDEIIERAGSGEKVPHSQVVERVRQAKPKSKPPAAEHREQHGGPPPMYVLDCEKAAAVPDRRAQHTAVNGTPTTVAPSHQHESGSGSSTTSAANIAKRLIVDLIVHGVNRVEPAKMARIESATWWGEHAAKIRDWLSAIEAALASREVAS